LDFRVEHQDRIVQIAQQATVDLLAGWGVQLRPRRLARLSSGATAVVPLTGDCLHGVVGLELNAALIDQLPPCASCSPRHWAKELTNQLSGRVRNELLAEGVDIDMGVPSSLQFAQVRIDTSQLGAAEFFYESGDGVVRVFFDFDPLQDPGFGRLREATPLSEGQSLFF